MADFDKNRFASKKQDWNTPNNIWQPLHKEFHFTLDVAADPLNAIVPNYITEEMDAMKTPWNHF